MSVDNLTLALERAVTLNEHGEIEQAELCLDGIFDQLPDDVRYLKLVGMLYQSLGADQKSLGLIAAASERAPNDPELQLALGFHFMDNGEPEKAVGF
ncbi:MAG: hypothetical protein O3A84_16955, partial [Proteobacteria bacterium]|nr:hypothetical protein [Pseudomonadota bacterium]